MDISIGEITALVMALSALVASVYGLRKTRAESRSIESDALSKITDAAGNISTMSNDQVERMKKRLDELEVKSDQRYSEYERRIATLEDNMRRMYEGSVLLYNQLIRANLSPEYDPLAHWREIQLSPNYPKSSE